MPRRPFLLETRRLRVRTLDRQDITEFTRYRNDPSVAHFQDWAMPYTRDLAHAVVDATEAGGGPVPGDWVQLAVTDHADRLLGDLAVWLDEAAQLATIGYTFAPEHQRKGYAAEAVAALLDWLFTHRRVHRVTATLDPLNVASARVLERNGFRMVGIARSAALVRGEWSDDARFELLADEWRSWKRRRPVKRVELAEIDRSNVRALLELDRAFSQRQFVSSVAQSYGDALLAVRTGGALVPWYRAIVADRQLAGFVMLAEPGSEHPHPYLWRFMVDWRQQGRGVGRLAIGAVARAWADAGATDLMLSCVAGVPGSPEGFYRTLGFVPTGHVNEWGETEMTAPITRLI